MDHNNIDAQLEAVFVTTDWATDRVLSRKNPTQMQEVYQTFIQRSYAPETPLRTSHQNRELPHCGKAINSTYYLEKHLRSCEKAPTYTVKQQLRQMALHEPT